MKDDAGASVWSDLLREVQDILAAEMNERLSRCPGGIPVSALESKLLDWAYGSSPAPEPGMISHARWRGVPVLVEPAHAPLGPDDGTRADRRTDGR